MDSLKRRERWPNTLSDALVSDLKSEITSEQILEEIRIELFKIKETSPYTLESFTIDNLDIDVVLKSLENTTRFPKSPVGGGTSNRFKDNDEAHRYMLFIARYILNELPDYDALARYLCQPAHLPPNNARRLVKDFLPPIFHEVCIKFPQSRPRRRREIN